MKTEISKTTVCKVNNCYPGFNIRKRSQLRVVCFDAHFPGKLKILLERSTAVSFFNVNE